jgi:hypothetical protein
MPSPGSYTDIFGGTNVYPSQPSYLSLNPFSASVVLGWPIEQAPAGSTVVADIIDVNPTTGGLTIQLSDATQASTGYCALFNNIGANSFNVLNNAGGVIATVASGTVWQLYLADNTTAAGTWRAFQFGVGTSSATAAALAGAGLIAITTTLNQNYVFNTQNTNYNAVLGDRAKLIEWTGGVGTLTLPNNATIPAGWFTMAKNSGSGIWTVSVAGGQTIDGSTTLALNPQQSCFLLFDGANFFTLGLGTQLNSIFDFVQISLAGISGNFVLSGVNLNRISYRFVGALAGNVTIVVPSTIQQYWVDNETSGAFTLTVSTGGGTSTAVSQGTRNILYCDSTNVVPAVTFGSTGFINGSVGTPSIFFTSSPHSGFYQPTADQIAISTLSTQRGLIDSAGHWTIQSSDDGNATFTVNGPGGGTGPALVIHQVTGGAASSPHLALTNAAVSGSSTISIAANGFTTGTSDVALFQGSTGGGTLINRFNDPSNGGIRIQTANGSAGVSLAPGNIGIVTAFNTQVLIGLQGVAGSINLQTPTTNSATAGGASALPATPVGYMEIQVNNGSARLPYYAP